MMSNLELTLSLKKGLFMKIHPVVGEIRMHLKTYLFILLAGIDRVQYGCCGCALFPGDQGRP